MSATDLDPALPRTASISLYDANRPALRDGDYRLSHKLTLKGERVDFKAGSVINGQASYQEFSVAGPRFSLSPDEIHSTFPPDLARGDFSSYVPHIALQRATLPWERSAMDVERETPPWMALLLLDPSEIIATEVVNVSTALSRLTHLKAETADEQGAGPEEKVRLITLSNDVANARLPELRTLQLCAHVRKATVDNVTTETATIIAAHRPKSIKGEAIRSVLHLVSLEGRYAKDATLPDIGNGDVTLVSLATWEIINEKPLHGFKELLSPVASHAKRLGFAAPDAAAPIPTALMAAGWVAVPHRLREGSQTLSWYHGPLIGDKASLPDIKLPHPAITADALNIVMKSQGMVDIAYASAWQLGRSLILARPQIARDLAQWKRADDAANHAEASFTQHAHLPHGISPPTRPRLNAVSTFFSNDLANLGAVPFRYLMPDEQLLPLESLRFFDIDAAWLRCLMDGALSVGRATSGDLERDAKRDHVLPDIKAVSGFFLRSAAVSGFPGLLFEGYERRVDNTTSLAPDTQQALGVVRAEKLGPNTLFVLFDGPLRTLDLHLHVQAMHFSLPAAVPIHDRGHIDMEKLATHFKLKGDDINSANLAYHLLSGAPLVRIEREAQQ